MKRISALLASTLVFCLLSPALVTAAGPSAGAACSKAGLVSTTSAKKFTCIKSGKKLIWNKGIAIATAYPTLHPVEGPYGITWNNLVSKINDISVASWVDAQATIKRNLGLVDGELNFYSYISPGALKIDPNIGEAEKLLKQDFALFAHYPHYPKVYFVALTTAEREETEKNLLASLNVTFINRSIDAMYGINSNSPAGSVFSAPQCGSSDSGRNIFTATEAAVIVGVCPSLNGRDNHIEGVHAMAHEYIHMIQSAFAPGQQYPMMPCWMIEGEPEWGQAAVSDNFADYLKVQHLHPYRLTQTGLNYEDTTAREWTASEVAEYLSDSVNTSTCSQTNHYAYSYSLGAAATEALVSIGGSESIFALHQRIVNQMPYEQAFKKVYGVSWAEAIPILSQVVAKKISLSWTPEALTYQTKP